MIRPSVVVVFCAITLAALTVAPNVASAKTKKPPANNTLNNIGTGLGDAGIVGISVLLGTVAGITADAEINKHNSLNNMTATMGALQEARRALYLAVKYQIGLPGSNGQLPNEPAAYYNALVANWNTYLVGLAPTSVTTPAPLTTTTVTSPLIAPPSPDVINHTLRHLLDKDQVPPYVKTDPSAEANRLIAQAWLFAQKYGQQTKPASPPPTPTTPAQQARAQIVASVETIVFLDRISQNQQQGGGGGGDTKDKGDRSKGGDASGTDWDKCHSEANKISVWTGAPKVLVMAADCIAAINAGIQNAVNWRASTTFCNNPLSTTLLLENPNTLPWANYDVNDPEFNAHVQYAGGTKPPDWMCDINNDDTITPPASTPTTTAPSTPTGTNPPGASAGTPPASSGTNPPHHKQRR